MKCVLLGSRCFGATALEVWRKEGAAEFARVVVPSADDRPALGARTTA